MSNENWTPGPWVAGTGYEQTDPGVYVFSESCGLVVSSVDTEPKPQDANLIAAAPELYEALDALRKWAFDKHSGEVPTDIAADVEYAICKAKGETQ